MPKNWCLILQKIIEQNLLGTYPKKNKLKESKICPMKFAIKKNVDTKNYYRRENSNEKYSKFYKTNYIINNMTTLLKIKPFKKQTFSAFFGKKKINK